MNASYSAMGSVYLRVQVLASVGAVAADQVVQIRKEARMIINATSLGDPPAPVSNITWEKIGNSSWATEMSTYLSSDRLTQRVPAMRYWDDGLYRVRVGNPAGEVTVDFTLHYREPPLIVTAPRAVTLNKGTTLQLQCVATGNPRPTMQWTHPSITIPATGIATAPYNTSSISQRKLFAVESNLTIAAVGLEAEGGFQCLASNTFPPSASASAVITVFIKPELVANLSSPSTTTNEHTARVELSCTVRARPAPTITWLSPTGSDLSALGSVIVNTSTPNVYHGNLVLRDIAKKQEGSYMCTGRTSYGSVSTNVFLRVQVLPSAMPVAEKQDGVQGKSVIIALNMVYAGDPTVPTHNITWTKVGNSTWQTRAAGYISLDRLYVTIPSVQFWDAGRYTVKIGNLAGEIVVNFTITYKVPPKVFKLPFSHSANKSTTTTFACTASGNPVPSIAWYHDSSPLPVNKSHITAYIDASLSSKLTYGITSILTLKHLHPSNNGVYKCVAQNGVPPGSAATANLTVFYGPNLQSATFNRLQAIEGSNVTAKFSFLSNPKPTYNWTAAPKLAVGTATRVSLSGQVPSFTFELHLSQVAAVSPVFLHNITFTVENFLGSTAVTREVTVQVKPRLLNGSAVNMTSNERQDNVTLTCIFQSVPVSSVTWIRHDGVNVTALSRAVSSSTHPYLLYSYLTLQNISKQDEGYYTCRGLNSVGVTSHQIFLRVQDLPRAIAVHQKEIGIQHSPSTLEVNITYRGDPQVPISNITWSKVGNSTWTAATSTLVSPDRLSLTIPRVHYWDEGQYMVNISNAAGQITVNFTLTYREPPVITSYPISQVVNEGSNVTFRCTVTGNPMPNVTWHTVTAPLHTWLYTNQQLVNSTLAKHLSFAVQSTLVLPMVMLVNDNLYECRASAGAFPSDTARANLTVYAPPVQILPTASITVLLHRPAVLHCNVSSVPISRISWYRDGKLLRAGDLGGRVTFSAMNVTLSLANVTYADGGGSVYHCEASNKNPSLPLVGGTMTGNHASVAVVGSPRIQFMSSTEFHVFENTTVDLNCTLLVNPEPNIQWIVSPMPQNTNTLWNGSRVSYPVFTSSVRWPYLPVYSNGHTYNITLVAWNQYGSDTRTVPVTIYAVPVFMSASSSSALIGFENQAVITLKCIFRSVPAPNITWQEQSDGRILSWPSRFYQNTTTPHVYHSELTITNLQVSDEGHYLCTAETANGTASAMVQLRVYALPRAYADVALQTGVKDMPLNLSLTVLYPGNPPINESDILWFKAVNDSSLLPLANSSISVDGLSLMVESMQYADAGKYIVELSNKLGSVTVNFTVRYEEPLQIRHISQNLEVNELDTARLQCLASGNPKPSISWHYGFTLVPANHTSAMAISNFTLTSPLTHDVQSTLILKSVTTAANAGVYRCIASNSFLSNVTASVNLTVYIRPESVPQEDTVLCNEHQHSVTVRCSFRALPPPTITWQHSGVDITSSSVVTANVSEPHLYHSVLILYNVTMATAGQYTCSARNQHGMKSSRRSVKVQVLPQASAVAHSLVGVRGRPATLRIRITYPGNPPAPVSNITWSQLVNDSWQSLANTSISADHLSYTIASVEYWHVGQYAVRIANPAGHTVVYINLAYGESPTFLSWPTDEVINEGDTARFSCRIRGFPAPDITWYHNRTLLPTRLSSTTIINGLGLSGNLSSGVASVLTLASVSLALNHGQYSCLAANSHLPSANASVHLRVFVPPKQTAFTQNATVQLGSQIKLHCNIYAVPLASITWTKDGQVLAKDGLGGRVSFAVSGDTLIIGLVEAGDAGIYRCSADNVDRTAPAAGGYVTGNHAYVTIQVAAKITESPGKAMVAYRGSPVSMSCRFSGTPQPTAHWCHVANNGSCLINTAANCPSTTQQMQGHKVTLDFAALENCHQGMYRCVVSNGLAMDMAEVKLTVQDKAHISIIGNFTGTLLEQAGATAQTINDLIAKTFKSLLSQNTQVNSVVIKQQQGDTITVKTDVYIPASVLANISGNASQTDGLYLLVLQSIQAGHSYPLDLEPLSVETQSYDSCAPNTTADASKGQVSWPETHTDTCASEPCPVALSDGISRFATRCCQAGSAKSAGTLALPRWLAVNMSQCPSPDTLLLFSLSTGAFNSSDPETLVSATQSLANLTQDSTALSKDDLNFATAALSNVVSAVLSGDGPINQSIVSTVVSSTVDFVDNILESEESTPQSTPAMRLRVTKSVERLVAALDVETGDVHQKHTENVAFAVSCPEPGSGLALRTMSENETFDIGPPATSDKESSDISFDIPQQAITLATMAQKASGDEDDNSSLCPVARTQFIVYKSAVLFQDKSLPSNGDGLTTVESGVISAQAGTDSVSSLSKPVEFSLKIDKPLKEGENVSCVFWDFNLAEGAGGWSSDGCHVVTSTGSDGNMTRCACDHLTNFALLVSRKAAVKISKTPVDIALSYISYIGVGLSIISTLATILTILSMKELRGRTHQRLMLGLCFTLLIFLCLFVGTSAQLAPYKWPCRVMGAVMHYLLLSAFLWTTSDALLLYLQIVLVFSQKKDTIIRLSIVSIFVLPSAIVITSAGATQFEAYGNQQYCWISSNPVFYGAFVAPMALCVSFNAVVFLKVVHSLQKRGKNSVSNKTKHKGKVYLLKVAVSLSALLGLSWIFGFLVSVIDHVSLQFLFTISTAMQGVCLFMYTLKSKDVRRRWSVRISSRMPSVSRPSLRMPNMPRLSSHRTYGTSFTDISSSERSGSSLFKRKRKLDEDALTMQHLHEINLSSPTLSPTVSVSKLPMEAESTLSRTPSYLPSAVETDDTQKQSSLSPNPGLLAPATPTMRTDSFVSVAFTWDGNPNTSSLTRDVDGLPDFGVTAPEDDQVLY
ncbi:hemicentin-2-like [Sycon ciliatum]|uniref:hemicentin-2-like n=1 Tax=Sycon ciliatum TaxID=27933 RepID=UPI0031F7017D